jgi:hypothetical protein
MDAFVVTGASSFGARPFLHALLRRQPRLAVLCDLPDDLLAVQAQLQPWCDQQGITTTLRLIGLDAIGHPPQLPASFLDALPGVAWLLHGDTVRANSLLAHNSCFAVQRNICAIQQQLAALPPSGLPLVLISSHLAHARTGIAGATLAAAEQLVAEWAALRPRCPVQIWRLPVVFDPAACLSSDEHPDTAWQRESLAEQFLQQLVAGGPLQRLISVSAGMNALQAQVLATAMTPPSCAIEQWLATFSAPLAHYDNETVKDGLISLWQ